MRDDISVDYPQLKKGNMLHIFFLVAEVVLNLHKKLIWIYISQKSIIFIRMNQNTQNMR